MVPLPACSAGGDSRAGAVEYYLMTLDFCLDTCWFSKTSTSLLGVRQKHLHLYLLCSSSECDSTDSSIWDWGKLADYYRVMPKVCHNTMSALRAILIWLARCFQGTSTDRSILAGLSPNIVEFKGRNVFFTVHCSTAIVSSWAHNPSPERGLRLIARHPYYDLYGLQLIAM